MRKIYTKLFFALLSLMAAASMVVSISYAWLTLSDSPAVNGMTVTISGGTTIMLAEDVTKVLDDGTVVHYPGAFSQDKLSFGDVELFSGLSPVSTADGLNWILPEYDNATGDIKDIGDFTVDRTLSAASDGESGKYVYLDFWIVSPGSEYNVHISTDAKTGQGSFVTELPDVIEGDTVSGYTLGNTQSIIAASARVGFLVNEDRVMNDGAMISYIDSGSYDERYKSLKGNYQEKGESVSELDSYSFTVYEPNADMHPFLDGNGDCYVTRPLAYNPYSDLIYESDINGNVAVQKSSTLKTTDSGILLEDILQVALLGKTISNLSDAKAQLYDVYLQRQVQSYIVSGRFFTSTENLYAHADKNGKIVSAIIENNAEILNTAGATEDAVITELEKNIPQRIRMYVWIEGQDIDCTNDSCIRKTDFTVNLELSGATK